MVRHPPKPQQEQIAKLHYERQGYDSCLLMMWAIVRHARRTEKKRKPFFPAYLFLRLAPDERNWVAISSIRGVLGPICFGGQYVPVPDWIITGLQAKEDGSGAVSLADLQKKRLTPGATVAVQLDDSSSTPLSILHILRPGECGCAVKFSQPPGQDHVSRIFPVLPLCGNPIWCQGNRWPGLLVAFWGPAWEWKGEAGAFSRCLGKGVVPFGYLALSAVVKS